MRLKLTYWLAVVSLALASTALHAQGTAKIHGHVNDPLARPMANVQVIISTNGVSAEYSFVTDKEGDYTGAGITPGTYAVLLSNAPGKMLDRVLNVKFAANIDTTINFDLSRPDYIASLPPEEQAKIAEVKQQTAQAQKDNAAVPKLNSMLKEARQDNQDKKYDDAANIMQQAVQAKADSAVLWLELGIAQTGQKKYPDALATVKKAIDLNAADPKPNPEITGSANNLLGEIYANTGKTADAAAAYDAAAKAEPAKAALYYTNETIILGRTTEADATAAAADKAIAADPNQPIPYYLKGQALISKATVDTKTNEIVAPPGTVEAYEKYLELAPNGQFVPDVKGILAQIGEKVVSKYSAKKK